MVLATTESKALVRLEEVFRQLLLAGLTLDPSRCAFFPLVGATMGGSSGQLHPARPRPGVTPPSPEGAPFFGGVV